MPENPIQVVVVKYPDRKNLMMRYVDPVTGRLKCRSTGSSNRRAAERAAAKWEAELLEGRYRPPVRMTWAEFRERYEAEKLAGLSPNTLEASDAAFNHLEKLVDPKDLNVLTSAVLSGFQSALRASGMKETTIATHLRHIRAALSWAVSMEILAAIPRIHMPARARGRTLMRGRPITAEEFERLLAAVAAIRPDDAEVWSNYLEGLWLSGLRLEESTVLSWDADAAISVVLTGRHPKLRIWAEAEKGHRDRLLPMTPDFAEFLLKTPLADRRGLVFKITGLQTGQPITPKRISRIVSAIGKKAGVVVNKADGKFASAHDLRRAFGTRWAPKVKPATLQLLMRHRSIDTTLKYYVAQDADDVGDELWRDYRPNSQPEGQQSERGGAV
jgi:integrase